MQIKSPQERFEKKIIKTYTCWLWGGSTNPRGYGYFNSGNKKTVTAHRFAYKLYIGEIADGLYAIGVTIPHVSIQSIYS